MAEDYPEAGSAATLERRLRALSTSGLLDEARRLDGRLADLPAEQTFVFWRASSPLAYGLHLLPEFDREARRASQMLLWSKEKTIPRPLQIGEAGFQVQDAAPGSVDFLLGAIGVTAQVLLSNPVQLVLTIQALIGDVHGFVGWLGHRAPRRRSARDLAKTLVDLRPERAQVTVGVDVPTLVLTKDGLHVSGSGTATIIRERSDGTRDYIRFDGRPRGK